MAINNNIKKLYEAVITNKEYENYNKFGNANILTIEKTIHNYFILLKNGTLLSIYSNSIKTLGRKIYDDDDEGNKIGKVEIKEQIIDVQCGKNHVLALSIDGSVYAWGESSPQVGHFGNDNESNDFFLPKKISYFEVKNSLKL